MSAGTHLAAERLSADVAGVTGPVESPLHPQPAVTLPGPPSRGFAGLDHIFGDVGALLHVAPTATQLDATTNPRPVSTVAVQAEADRVTTFVADLFRHFRKPATGGG